MVSLSRSQISKASFAVPLTGKVPHRESKKNAFAALRGKHKKTRNDTVALDGASFDREYLVNITVGGKNFQVILDTGSSDTWVVHQNSSCLDLEGNPVPAATCDFGPAQFNPADSPTFQLFSNVTFFVRYGSGEFLSGPAGFDNVSVGGLSVSQQEIGVPNLNAFLGDGVSEGVLGLAFRSLTSVWNTTDKSNASSANHILYNPFFLTAVEQKKVNDPYFFISLDRPRFEQQVNDPFDPKLGFLAFGGMVPVPVLDTAVTVPVQGYSKGVPSNSSTAQFQWYSLDIDAYVFPGSQDVVTANNATFLDSGTTLNWVPTPVAEAYNAQFSPPATLNSTSGMYVVECNATAPEFAVVVGGVSFTIDPRDQVVPQGKDADGNTVCVSGTQDEGPVGNGNTFILGDVFLHNVVTTHNPVDAEVTLAQLAPY
ncbi:aspartic peptidase domain-containing protein [Mycena epipterygia]|nr:aspartic peptidase domain-containing protein [Mycena epipterygia]